MLENTPFISCAGGNRVVSAISWRTYCGFFVLQARGRMLLLRGLMQLRWMEC
jgi:hypothetical protein